MRGIVVEQDDVVSLQLGHEEALHKRAKGESIDAAFYFHRSNESLRGKSSDDRMRQRSVSGNAATQTLPFGRPAVATHQVGVDAAFIEEDEPGTFGAERLHQLPMRGAFGWVLFAGREHLLFFG